MDTIGNPALRQRLPQSAADIVRRTATVLGDGPRILPLELNELSAELLTILDRMAQVNAALDSRDKEALT